eukprot:6183592-Pleurochrysis_carterae.AAC.1
MDEFALTHWGKNAYVLAPILARKRRQWIDGSEKNLRRTRKGKGRGRGVSVSRRMGWPKRASVEKRKLARSKVVRKGEGDCELQKKSKRETWEAKEKNGVKTREKKARAREGAGYNVSAIEKGRESGKGNTGRLTRETVAKGDACELACCRVSVVPLNGSTKGDCSAAAFSHGSPTTRKSRATRPSAVCTLLLSTIKKSVVSHTHGAQQWYVTPVLRPPPRRSSSYWYLKIRI